MTANPGTIALHVLYPRDETSTFNLEYYLSTHMALAEKAWKEHGLLTYNVIEAPDPKSPYSIATFLTWEARGESGMDGVMAGFASELGKALAEDVPNFSNRTPAVVVGPVKASNSV
ncbi:hypothetical protein PV10_00770 [Exophiala mesophila]|uniref:EthD domain-containing protein n=1 Tax=Exophiala mesophila TaxID=212818 RepID=A0A0D1X578_EXOME|nr:uncharacterized protein PV10_00770 [Exophiala mesophila]KIV96960.1 hypothetical protein PV10_00770 [Exophiala mesophila]